MANYKKTIAPESPASASPLFPASASPLFPAPASAFAPAPKKSTKKTRETNDLFRWDDQLQNYILNFSLVQTDASSNKVSCLPDEQWPFTKYVLVVLNRYNEKSDCEKYSVKFLDELAQDIVKYLNKNLTTFEELKLFNDSAAQDRFVKTQISDYCQLSESSTNYSDYLELEETPSTPSEDDQKNNLSQRIRDLAYTLMTAVMSEDLKDIDVALEKFGNPGSWTKNNRNPFEWYIKNRDVALAGARIKNQLDVWYKGHFPQIFAKANENESEPLSICWVFDSLKKQILLKHNYILDNKITETLNLYPLYQMNSGELETFDKQKDLTSLISTFKRSFDKFNEDFEELKNGGLDLNIYVSYLQAMKYLQHVKSIEGIQNVSGASDAIMNLSYHHYKEKYYTPTGKDTYVSTLTEWLEEVSKAKNSIELMKTVTENEIVFVNKLTPPPEFKKYLNQPLQKKVNCDYCGHTVSIN